MAGYSGTPLVKKLGIKENASVFILQAPRDYFKWISPLPNGVVVHDRAKANLDFIHLFADRKSVFQKTFVKLKKNLKPDGMLWVSWPKKSSGVATDLDENIIREFGLKAGLVDVKVCAVDDTWSGLKFVIRLSDR